jgi:hypothetical protein
VAPQEPDAGAASSGTPPGAPQDSRKQANKEMCDFKLALCGFFFACAVYCFCAGGPELAVDFLVALAVVMVLLITA